MTRSEQGHRLEKDSSPVDPYLVKDPELFARNISKMLEAAGQAAATWSKSREGKPTEDPAAGELTEIVRIFSRVAEYWMAEPQRVIEAQTKLFGSFMSVWANSIQRLGHKTQDMAISPARSDKRFKDPDWNENAFFNFMQQTYLMLAKWLSELVDEVEGLDAHTQHKARFYMRQIVNAISPSNFVFTNPEVFRETAATSGENLVRGLSNLAEDIKEGGGELKLRQTDRSVFEVGRNIANTKGSVIARSEIAEIIHYQPLTKTVFKRPLLICPPWINKFYILDLNPEKSFIRWALEQGHPVFVISWVNPDARHAQFGWEDYITQGIDFALDTIEQETGSKEVNAIGYCVGGTLLAAALALHAKRGDTRVKSVTFFTTQVDFTYAGDLKVFADEAQISALEENMQGAGYLDGSKMANAFNMLRSAELIWPYVVNSYLRGKDPLPFDLLYWNSDSTRMAARNHSFYLRNCYLDNALAKGKMKLGGELVRLSDIKIPVYNLAAIDDHIAPAQSVFLGCQYFGGDVEYVMSGSGHIAGVINPPSAKKYQYWSGPKPDGEFEDWSAKAKETAGSWWPHWQHWIRQQDGKRVKPYPVGKAGNLLADAPGTYVRA